MARDQAQALEAVIALGCERVLTSGAQATALQGADAIAALVRQADRRIRVMAGAGITADSLGELATRSGADEFHASAKAVPHLAHASRATNAWPASTRIGSRPIAERVRALRAVLDAR